MLSSIAGMYDMILVMEYNNKQKVVDFSFSFTSKEQKNKKNVCSYLII